MGVLSGTEVSTTYRPPVRRTTYKPSARNPGEIAVVNRPSTASPRNPGEIAIANTPKPSFKNPGEIAVINTPVADPRGEPWIDYVPDYAGGGGAGGGGGKSTSSTDSSKQEPGISDEEQAKLDEAKADADKTLKAQLDAAAARFGLTRAQLDAEQGEIGRQWENAKMQLFYNAYKQNEANVNSMIERGILKSGIAAQDYIELQRQKEIQAGTLDTDQRVSKADVAARRAALGPQEEAEKARINAEHAQKLRDLEIMRAAYGQE